MNFDFYLFGTPDGYDQYPLDDKESLFQSFHDKKSSVQLTVYRKAELVFFNYLRNLDADGKQFFGMSIVLNGSYPDSILDVFEVFELLFDGIVRRGQILARNSHGKVHFVCSRLTDAMEEIEATTRDCHTLVEMRLGSSAKVLPEEYAVQSREASFVFDSGFIPVNLNELLKFYDKIYFKKTEEKQTGVSEPKPPVVWLIPALIIIAAVLFYYYFYQNKSIETKPSTFQQDIPSENQEFSELTTNNTTKPSEIVQTKTESVHTEKKSQINTNTNEEQRTTSNSTNNNDIVIDKKHPENDPKPKEQSHSIVVDKPKEENKPKELSQQRNNIEQLDDQSNVVEDDDEDSDDETEITWEVKDKVYPEGKYTGTLRNHTRNGFGILEFNNGDRYEGEWKTNEMHGSGIYYFKNGDKCVGTWKNGKRQEDYVELYFSSGETYKGSLLNGKYNGQGTMQYNSTSSTVSYTGQWKNGKRNGYGTLRMRDGGQYEGEFKDGLFDGEGTYYFKSGERYVGGFKEGKYDGKGIEYFANGIIRAEGIYKKGEKISQP